MNIPADKGLSPDITPPKELQQRLDKVRQEMARDDIACIILTDRTNIEYFTDYHSLSWAYHARPLIAMLSQDGFVLVASVLEVRNIESRERPFNPALYDGYAESAVSKLLAELIKSFRGAMGQVGVDYGQDMFGRGSLDLVHGLMDLSCVTEVVSACDVIWRVRQIKTRREAELKRRAFEIADNAFDEAIGAARLGMTERELYADLQSRLFLHGADRADPIAMVFAQGAFIYNRYPGARQLEDGDYIWTDFRSTYQGYPADKNRIARAGKPAAWERDLYTTVRDLTIRVARDIKAEMTCGEVFANYQTAWKAVGLKPAYKYLSRIGHGGGLGVTEPPSLARGSGTVIREGMILHIEPKLEHDGAVFQFEEVVYVTADGAEFLGRHAPAEIPVVSS